MNKEALRNQAAVSGQSLYERAKRLIPGGTQLLSKRPEMFLPDYWPSYYSRAKGAEVWDLQGNKYVDMSYSSLGACVLGYADEDVDDAVRTAIDRGTSTTLNCPEEVELAELLLELHPWAQRVRYARTGGEAMAVAVRIARAATGREKVAFCGYHGWSDWYLSANLGETDALDGHLLPGLEPNGVPRGLHNTAFPFSYNRIEELESIFDTHGLDFAAVVMEPVRNYEPAPGFLEGVRKLARKNSSVLIFDEITSGWRKTDGGAHLSYGVNPDICVFAKGMSNGYPMAAIIGIAGIMEAAQKSFISSSNWTERVGPTAALATIRKFRALGVADSLIRVGKSIRKIWTEAAEKTGIQLSVSGIPALGHFEFRCENPQEVRTLFTQLMLEQGFLATNAFYAMHAHNQQHVAGYLEAVEGIFSTLAEAIEKGTAPSMLKGPVAHTGFRRLT